MQQSCWTGVVGTPGVTGLMDGSLHYCNQRGANVSFALDPEPNHGASDLMSVTLIYKAGPDCGMVNVSLDGQMTQAIDTYAPLVHWQASKTIAAALDGSQSHVFDLVVAGKANPFSSDTWVQISGVNIVYTPTLD